jgi:hypothetical protein
VAIIFASYITVTVSKRRLKLMESLHDFMIAHRDHAQGFMESFNLQDRTRIGAMNLVE